MKVRGSNQIDFDCLIFIETKYIITTDDLKPPTFSVEEWRLNAGKRLAEFLAKIPEKVVVAACGDLAHFHPTDCPEPVYMPDPR